MLGFSAVSETPVSALPFVTTSVSVAVTDGADVAAIAVGPIVAVSSATTDGADICSIYVWFWGAVDDSQTPNWTPVNDTQTGAWTDVDDAQTPNWTQIAA